VDPGRARLPFFPPQGFPMFLTLLRFSGLAFFLQRIVDTPRSHWIPYLIILEFLPSPPLGVRPFLEMTVVAPARGGERKTPVYLRAIVIPLPAFDFCTMISVLRGDLRFVNLPESYLGWGVRKSPFRFFFFHYNALPSPFYVEDWMPCCKNSLPTTIARSLCG